MPHDPVDLAKVRMVPYFVSRLIPKFPKMSAHIKRKFERIARLLISSERVGQLERQTS